MTKTQKKKETHITRLKTLDSRFRACLLQAGELTEKNSATHRQAGCIILPGIS